MCLTFVFTAAVYLTKGNTFFFYTFKETPGESYDKTSFFFFPLLKGALSGKITPTLDLASAFTATFFNFIRFTIKKIIAYHNS